MAEGRWVPVAVLRAVSRWAVPVSVRAGAAVSGEAFPVLLAMAVAVSAIAALLSVDTAPERRSPPQAVMRIRRALAMVECSVGRLIKERRLRQPRFI